MSSNVASSSDGAKPSKEDLDTQKIQVLANLEQEAGKVALVADLDKKYRDRLHELHRTDPQSPDIPALESHIQELAEENKNVRERYNQESKKLQDIQTAIDDQSKSEKDAGPSVLEVKAELDERIEKQGGVLQKTKEDVKKLKETVGGHAEQIARHGQFIETLKQGTAPQESDPSASSGAAQGQSLKSSPDQGTGENNQGSGTQESQALVGSPGVPEVLERGSAASQSAATGTRSISGGGNAQGTSAASQKSSQIALSSGHNEQDGVRSNPKGSTGSRNCEPPTSPSEHSSSRSTSHICFSSLHSSDKEASVPRPVTKDVVPQIDQIDSGAVTALQENIASVEKEVEQHDDAIFKLGKIQEGHGAMLADHDDAITRQIEASNALQGQVNQHSEILGQQRETVAGHDVHLGYHTNGLKEMGSKVTDQSLTLARVDTKLRHHDQQLNAYHEDGRLLAAQGQKLDHIEEKVQSNDARVEQVERVVQSLQQKDGKGPPIWPWFAAGGGVAVIAGLGGLFLWLKKKKASKENEKASKVVDDSEDDKVEETDASEDPYGTTNLTTKQAIKKGRPRRRPRPNRLHARHWNVVLETEFE